MGAGPREADSRFSPPRQQQSDFPLPGPPSRVIGQLPLEDGGGDTRRRERRLPSLPPPLRLSLSPPLFYLPVFAPELTCALPHHYPHGSARHCKFLFSSPSSASVMCPSPRTHTHTPRCDPSLPSCQSLLFLAVRWPGQSVAPGPRAAAVMTGNAGLHTLSTNMWRSACHTCPQLHCTHTHTLTHSGVYMDNCQALTFSSASLSDELLCSRNPPFLRCSSVFTVYRKLSVSCPQMCKTGSTKAPLNSIPSQGL